jgi:hypothetical protein
MVFQDDLRWLEVSLTNIPSLQMYVPRQTLAEAQLLDFPPEGCLTVAEKRAPFYYMLAEGTL